MRTVCLVATACASLALAQSIPVDLSGVKSGPVGVTADTSSITVVWPDERKRAWTAVFSLESRRPLISSIRVGGKTVVASAQPFYRCETGKRRGGSTGQLIGLASAYASEWGRHFACRLQVSRLIAQWAMRPAGVGCVLPFLRRFPSVLTWFARLSGKTHPLVEEG